jgi:hypothetical protein
MMTGPGETLLRAGQAVVSLAWTVSALGWSRLGRRRVVGWHHRWYRADGGPDIAVDWWQLRHAYGRATDTPATGRAHPDTVEPLVEFLGWAASSVSNLAGNRHFAELLPDLTDAVAAAYPVAYALLEFAAPDRTLFHVEHLVAMARIPALADRREELAALVRSLAHRDPGRRASWVHCLGLLGVDLRGLLTDADPGVRLRAALMHQNDPQAREQVPAALGKPVPPGLHQYELVAASIHAAPNFEVIAAAACEVARRDSWTGFADGWGALVSFAFPEPYSAHRPLTHAQRALLRALAANEQLWDSLNGSCAYVFKQAGLPHHREACRQLAT